MCFETSKYYYLPIILKHNSLMKNTQIVKFASLRWCSDNNCFTFKVARISFLQSHWDQFDLLINCEIFCTFKFINIAWYKLHILPWCNKDTYKINSDVKTDDLLFWRKIPNQAFIIFLVEKMQRIWFKYLRYHCYFSIN